MTDQLCVSIPTDGVVCAWAMSPSGKQIELNLDDISNVIADDQLSVWLHLNLSNSNVQRWIEKTPLVPARAVDLIKEGITRSRAEKVEKVQECLFMVMNDVEHEFGSDDLSSPLGTLWVILTPRLMISLRHRPLHTTDTLRSELRTGQIKPTSCVELLHELLDLRAEFLRSLLFQLSEQMDDLEEALLKGLEITDHESLRRIRIQCSRLRRQFGPELVALHRLQKHLPNWYTNHDKVKLIDDLDVLSFLIQDTSHLHDRAKMLQDEHAAQMAELNSRNLQVLSVMTVIFMPMTLITGIMGMNMEDLPGLKESFGVIMVLMALSGTVVYSVLKYRKII